MGGGGGGPTFGKNSQKISFFLFDSVPHVDHFLFADLGTLFILPAVKKDHKEFAILLIATSRFCCKFFCF